MTVPDNSCRQITVFATQSSSKTSDKVALSLGSICSMRPIICLLSRGKSRNSRQGPLMTSGFFSVPSSEALLEPLCDSEWCLVSCPDSVSASLVTASCTSPVDLEGTGSEILLISVPGVGGEAKSL